MEQRDPSGQEASGSQALRILRHKVRDGSLKELFQDWKWILSFTRGHRVQIIIYTLLGICVSSLNLVTGVVSKYLIDCIMTFDRSRLLPLAVLMIISAIVGLALQSISSRYSARLNVTMRNHVQKLVFRELLSSRWLQIRQFSTGDLMNRFSGDVSTVASCAVSWLPNVVIQCFTVLATLMVVLYYDPVMALIALASTPALILTSRRLMRRQRSFNLQLRSISSGMSAFESETFRNVDTLKSFGVEQSMEDKLQYWQKAYRDVVIAHNDFSVRTSIILTMMGSAVQYLALGYCLWRLWSGKILVGTMVLFLQQRANLSGAFSSLISLIPTALSGSVASERLQELTHLDKEPRNRTAAEATGSCSVTLTDVSAAYEDGRQVLHSANFHVPAGEIAALVGPSGEGKSTMIRLMLGLIQPDSGEGVLEDSRGTRFSLGADTRHLFAYVPQGNTVLAGTIAENLQLVNPAVTREQMEQALKDACAWEVVSQMPAGLDSVIGENGKGLSEGQAQRIAIARALVRQAPVMLLDEVTSALDYDTERQVLKNLTNRGVTCIVATHRPSVLALCARVYRVSDGRVYPLTNDQIQALIQFDN